MTDDLPELDWPCPACYGTGTEYGAGKNECPCCDGSGYRTSELGDAILALVQHHFRLPQARQSPADSAD